MPVTKVIAKKDLSPLFIIGDKLEIIPILYEEDTEIVSVSYGVYENDKFRRFASEKDCLDSKLDIRLMNEAVVAKKGSLKDYSIMNHTTGNVVPNYHLRIFDIYFDKVNW